MKGFILILQGRNSIIINFNTIKIKMSLIWDWSRLETLCCQQQRPLLGTPTCSASSSLFSRMFLAFLNMPIAIGVGLACNIYVCTSSSFSKDIQNFIMVFIYILFSTLITYLQSELHEDIFIYKMWYFFITCIYRRKDIIAAERFLLKFILFIFFLFY